MLGHEPKGSAEEGRGGRSRAELVDAEEEEATGEVEDVTITESATTAVTGTGIETETGAVATNDWSDPAQLR